MTHETQQAMMNYFTRAGIELSKQQEEQFWTLYKLLVQYNEEYDLSRLIKFDDIIQKHFIDSAIITTMTDIPSPLVDIGTGPGFPGIPLKIMRPDVSIILAEPRAKRVTFMEMVIEKLGLENISVYPHLVTDKSFFTVDGVITRAFESIDGTMSRVRHFLPKGGHILYMKGPGADKDLAEISHDNRKFYSIQSDRAYTLPGTKHERRLLVLQKEAASFNKTYMIFHNINETTGQPITSAENKRYKEFKKLNQTAGMKKDNKVIVAGKKIIEELCEPDSDEALVIYDGYKEDSSLIDSYINRFNDKRSLYILKRELYNELDQFKTNGPLLVKPFPVIPEWDHTKQDGCTVLIPFQDPANVGSVIRSAVGFNVTRIVILNEAAHPFHPKSIRTSAGTVFNANLAKGPSIKKLSGIIKEHNLTLFSLDKNGEDIRRTAFPGSFLLLPGIEGPGLPEELKTQAVSIPLDKRVESLNAAISTSIALYEWKRQC